MTYWGQQKVELLWQVNTVVIGGPWRIDMLENIDENPKNILDRLAPDTRGIRRHNPAQFMV